MRRSPLRRALLTTFAAGLLLGGCGGGGTAPEEWAADVCNGLQEYITQVTDVQTDVQNAVSPETTPEEGRTLLGTAFDRMIESTDELIGKIEDAGTPDVEGGEEVADKLVAGLTDVKEALENARPKIDELPDDPAAFQTEAQALGQEVQTELQGIGDAISAIQAPELEEATQDVEACQGVGA